MCFSRVSIAEVLVDLRDIAVAEQVGRSIHWLIGTGMDRLERSNVGLEIPIRRPTPIIERRRCRQSGVPAEDAGKLPASNDCVCSLVGIS